MSRAFAFAAAVFALTATASWSQSALAAEPSTGAVATGKTPISVGAVQQTTAAGLSSPLTADRFAEQLTSGGFQITDTAGNLILKRQRGVAPVLTVSVQALIAGLSASRLSPDRVEDLWGFLADTENAALVRLDIVAAMASLSTSLKAREGLWSALAAQATEFARPTRVQERAGSLLGLFEDHRDMLLPLLSPLVETEGAGDEMVNLMLASRVFGDDVNSSINQLAERVPEALARRFGRERDLGRPVKWEWQAFDTLVAWKDKRLAAGGVNAPRSVLELDAAGDAFVVIFNNLHAFDDWYRARMLRGLGPVELFNIVVGGELELYRMGTSGYRGMLHGLVLAGIRETGSFEAFLDRAAPRGLLGADKGIATRRGMVFIRVASSFGLLDTVLETVGDRTRFIADAISSLGDPGAFEANSAVVLDILTNRSVSPAALEFKNALLAKLYDQYRAEPGGPLRSVYGSMLSVYQTVTGDQRDPAISVDFALDGTMLAVPFDRLFSRDGRGGHVHRMFMRMDKDIDAYGTYSGFRTLMTSLGATVRHGRHYNVFRFAGRNRTIEIYANKPGPAGIKYGMPAIAEALRGARVETVIGRGHTSIIEALQEDTRRVLGDRINDVTAVIVGTCGGDASVRDLIGTFGYVRYVTTKSTGRQTINNAIIKSYIAALLSLPRNSNLSLGDVVGKATLPFVRPGADDELKDDANFYQVSIATVLSARLFDQHVRRFTEPERRAARE